MYVMLCYVHRRIYVVITYCICIFMYAVYASEFACMYCMYICMYVCMIGNRETCL